MANYTRKQGNQNRRGSKQSPKLVFSYQYLDIKQGQSFQDWEKTNDLIKLINFEANLNKLTFAQALAQQLIIQYNINDSKKWDQNNMPKVSKWNYPATVPSNTVQWCKIELGRKLRVIGYYDSNLNIFYVVFLDKNHEFFPSSS